MNHFSTTMLQIISATVLFTVVNLSKAEMNFREPSRNNLANQGSRGTLDKVKIIGHMSSGRCLVVENRKRQGLTREDQLVLWSCHDRQIKGLEQEMFSFIKSNGGGYIIMGYAGGSYKCVAARGGYNDYVVTHKCDPYDQNQSWIFRRTHSSKNAYQIVQRSSGRCVRAPGIHDGAWVRIGDCDLNDERQRWQICGLDGLCDF